MVDESGNAIRKIVNAYGPEGELLQVTGSTEPATYVYDALYRVSILTDGGGGTTHYYYNALGWLDSMTYPGYSGPAFPNVSGPDSVRYPTYDNEGNPLTRTDGNGATTTYAYTDAESRLTDITYSAGTIGPVHLHYDAYGRRDTMTDGTGGQTYAYDDDDDLLTKAVTWAGLAAKSVAYAYNPDGSRKTMTAVGLGFTYTYDGDGRLSALKNNSSETTKWAYRDNDWLLSKTLSNSVLTTYTQNPLGLPTDVVNKASGGTVLSDFSAIHYDGVGNKLSVTVPAPSPYAGTTTYQYDGGQTANPALNRSQLTGETSTRGTAYTNLFTYDNGVSGGSGNATAFKSSVQNRAYNADNQLTNSGFVYDGNGSPTTYNAKALTFDPEQRLTGFSTAQTNGFDGDGLRTWKQTGAATTRTYFLYDGSLPVCEFGSTGTLTAANTFGTDGLVSRHTTATTFYAFDERGNVAQRLSSTGAVTSSDLYDTYGARTSTAAQTDPFEYEGQFGYFTDAETGLLLCTHRFYDPAAGRFVTRDPIGYDGGINLYGYTGNNPVNESDPDGTDYFGDVWQVIAGYGDVLNPVNWGKGVAQLAQIAGANGFGAAGSALGQGVWHGLTDWTTTGDPRQFGQSFGTTLMVLSPGIKRIPNPTSFRLLGPFGDGDGITLLRVDNINRLGGNGVSEPQLGRLDIGRLPSQGKGALTIPPKWRGKFFLHYHRRGPGGIARHCPWQGGAGRRW